MRELIRQLPGSKIREVANAGLGRSDVLAFWFGEGDDVTPGFVRDAAVASLGQGETFYSHNLGLHELREALAGYVGALHLPLGPERIAVTSSGVNALMIAMQALVGAGDEVVAVVPVWPNLTAQPVILGALVTRVPLRPQSGAWRLDLDELLAAVTPRTRVLLVNAPNNPTGWTLSRDEQAAILAHCRRTGTWIVADEVYERLYFGGDARAGGPPAAPSFLDVAEADDRLLVAHSFSKSFLMTGWRLGWLVLPPALLDAVGKLIEFNTSCAPVFVQRAGLAAVQGAGATVPGLVAHLRTCRDTLLPALQALPGLEVAVPEGGMYAFFRVVGEADSLAFAKRLVAEAGLGLAPGAAFGPEAEGWLRWCFASRDPDRLTQGVERLRQGLRL
ncbi:pyridoxal phosphate-dependent aminotransferase [Methylibium petroleiphilum]|uniref:pyridoxal phosphate-dependent aminotransferase n=1 Tax=Methylibium petroleiphilum TaxID=105560 RepID=UPI001AC788F6|nr:pyridoxal phosphate-dependent aminotransferase [Methylibium petroleiphilum]MBN9203139.1 pyridoxal phosphate-dependent aminotransferase [Methylibium petroleiphilum]